jgi:hypothetical protein
MHVSKFNRLKHQAIILVDTRNAPSLSLVGSMRILGSIVQVPACQMADIRKHHATSNAIAAETIGDEASRFVSQSLQHPLAEPPGSRAVSPLLHQDLKNHAILVDSTPEIMQNAVNADEHVIEVPRVSRRGRRLRSRLANSAPNFAHQSRMLSWVTMPFTAAPRYPVISSFSNRLPVLPHAWGRRHRIATLIVTEALDQGVKDRTDPHARSMAAYWLPFAIVGCCRRNKVSRHVPNPSALPILPRTIG